MNQNNDESIDVLSSLVSSLANSDSIKIFLASEKGIENSTKTIKQLGLSQKRYYTWLKRQADAGLIEKTGGVYKQTTLGKVCYELGKVLSNALNQRDKLRLVDRLTNSDLLSLKEAKELLAVSEKDLADLIRPVKMFTNYDELIEELVNLADGGKKSIVLASYYPNIRVVKAILEASKRGLQMRFIAGSGKKNEIVQTLRLFLSPRLMKGISDFLKSGAGVNVRKISIPYCFCVIDEEYAVFEIPHPIEKTFTAAFLIHNEDMSRRLTGIFNSLYERGEEMDFATKHLR